VHDGYLAAYTNLSRDDEAGQSQSLRVERGRSATSQRAVSGADQTIGEFGTRVVQQKNPYLFKKTRKKPTGS
jgi:hypothetical protein